MAICSLQQIFKIFPYPVKQRSINYLGGLVVYLHLVLTFTLRPLFFCLKWNRRLCGPQIPLRNFGGQSNPLTLPEIEPRSLRRPARTVVDTVNAVQLCSKRQYIFVFSVKSAIWKKKTEKTVDKKEYDMTPLHRPWAG